jgi:5S rRNA maturation endonuclease (ribonuclease M5)
MTREEIIAANPIVDFVRSRGHELKPAGRNFVTNGCPVTQHKRGHRPLMIYPETQSWNCHDCERGGSVIDWIKYERGCDAAEAMRLLGGGRNGAGEIVATYDYTDENGTVLFQCVRFQPKDFRQRQSDGSGGWIWNLEGVRRVLYRLPDVIAAQTVCVAEGEKDADNLRSLGFTATTNPMGAGKWRSEYSETLRDKDVVIFGDVGDKDGKGEKHTAQVIQSLNGAAKSIKHVTLPDGFRDVSLYIASLSPTNARDEISKLIEETPEIDFKSGNSVDVDEPYPSRNAEAARELQKDIAAAQIDVQSSREGPRVELPPPPTPYRPPPLTLLPSVLQEYVHAAAESLNVDVSFLFLPMLGALASAIGNARSILLKRGFVQPPIIWTGIIGRSGERKSPALEAACFPIMEHEQELVRQNENAHSAYLEELAQWESESKKLRGAKPREPAWLTCLMDDLTLATLADALHFNPHGVLVKKDELKHWFASFDQFHNAKGADVTRWLTLHTGVFFGFDRRTDKRSYRIFDPRVSIAGGIQPKVLKQSLTPDFFDQGLPARFLFAHPPFRKDRWTEATVSDDLKQGVRELFENLWLLQPLHDDHGEPCPKLLRLTREAKEIYIDYYDDCGDAALEGDDRAEAAWSKLSGYGGRFALVGQLTCNPQAEEATGEVMQEACSLSRWFGAEAVRIYAELSETTLQREQRKLCEFIERRGGDVYERDVMQSFTRLKNDKAGTERELTALVKAGRGKWEPVEHSGGPGRPTRKFRLLRSSTSTQFGISQGKTANSVDVDASNSQKMPSVEPNKEAVSGELEVMPTGILEL